MLAHTLTWACCAVRQDASALYRGMQPKLLQTVSNAAIIFMIYERLLRCVDVLASACSMLAHADSCFFRRAVVNVRSSVLFQWS
jgi:hypothetical protein